MIEIDLDEVEALIRRKNEINEVDFKDIRWMRNGKPVIIPATMIEVWNTIGLNNVAFVETCPTPEILH